MFFLGAVSRVRRGGNCKVHRDIAYPWRMNRAGRVYADNDTEELVVAEVLKETQKVSVSVPVEIFSFFAWVGSIFESVRIVQNDFCFFLI